MLNKNKVMGTEYKAVVNYKNKNYHWKSFLLFLYSIQLLVVEFATQLYRLLFPKEPDNISNQLALVTGGANGLGKAFCFRLAQEKCDIAVVDLDYQSSEKTAKEIEERFGVKSRAYKCDISNQSAVLELKDKIEKDMKTVDILVNNAGLLYMYDFLKSDANDIKKVIDVNMTSQILMVHTFLPKMIEQKRGKILSVSSITALQTMPSCAVYASTKFAVKGFMECLHDELCVVDRDEFITLTTVYPDFMNTRKELSDVLDEVDFIFPRLAPERVADEGIRGLLTNKKTVFCSDIKHLHFLMRSYPNAVRKELLKVTSDIKSMFK